MLYRSRRSAPTCLKTISVRTFAFLLFAALSITAHAAKWDEMDYGRFLSATYLNPEGKSTLDGKGSATNKGIAVKLGNNEGALLFDTELCRMAGGWTGGFVQYKGVVFDGAHGPNPGPADKVTFFFQVDPGPGWSKADDFKDPRKLPSGPGAAKVPFGPLPKEWARYRGLYLHGDNVVLHYSVGRAEILELPGLEQVSGSAVLTRTFAVIKPGPGASLALADAAIPGVDAALEDGAGVVANDPKNPDSRAVIRLLGMNQGAQIEAHGGRATLRIRDLVAGQTFKIVYATGLSADVPQLSSALKGAAKIANLDELKRGGPSHWPETVTTKGALGKDDAAYALDTIALPFDNPYKSWIRIGGLDFFRDGRMAVCTWSGDVWIANGIDEKLEKVTWKRYATGLFQALGLKIVDEQIHVLGRDQITRLHDLNNDSEADWYECFNNDVQVTPGFHEFAFDLQTDPQGNFYFTKAGPVNPGGSGWGPLSDHNGCIFKISKDGQKFEVFATGLRAPNGMGVGPKGEVTVGDNEGTWVPTDYIHLVRQSGEFIEVPDLAHREPVPTAYTPHLCWMPKRFDNSCGSHVWVTSDKWGPLAGNLLYVSYGKCALFNVLQEKVGDVVQGGVVRFPFKFESGSMRARFHPVDGQLYVAGLKGWQTEGAKDASVQRVRYTGKNVYLPNALRVTNKGIHIGFIHPVDPVSAGDAGNYSIEQWNYRWTKNYGSAEYKVSNPEEKGHDTVAIASVTVAPDRKGVFLEVPDLKPVMQMLISMNIKAEDGSPMPKEIAHTINVVGNE